MSRQNVYNVERIVDSRKLNGKKQYHIKWEGYGDEFNTWEDQKDIFCKDLITKYETRRRSTTPRKTRKRKSAASDEACARKETPEELRAATESVEPGNYIQGDSWESIVEVMTVQWNTAAQRLDVQFKTVDGNVGIVPASDAHFHFPQALIAFYEKHISFQSDPEGEIHPADV